MSVTFLIFILFFSSGTESQWSFHISQVDDGAFIPDWKDKEVGYKFGEDYFVTTPYGIAVADGVGGSKLASLHLSKHLTTSFGQWILGCHYARDKSKLPLCKDFDNRHSLSVILDVMKETITKKLNLLEDIIKKESAKLEGKPNHQVLRDRPLDQSSTFVSAYLSQQSSTSSRPPLLNVFQKGDSLALILRFDQVSKNWKPFAYTTDDQYKFNNPFQYKVFKDFPRELLEEDRDVRFFSVRPKEHDVVILGSDGLFDNIPVSAITLAFNAMVRELSQQKDSSKKPKLKPRFCLKWLVSAYKRLISKLKPSDFEGSDEAAGVHYIADDFERDWKERKMAKENAKLKAKKVDQGPIEPSKAESNAEELAIRKKGENGQKLRNQKSLDDGEFQNLALADLNEDDEFEVLSIDPETQNNIEQKKVPLDKEANKIAAGFVIIGNEEAKFGLGEPVVEKKVLKCKIKGLFFHTETKKDFNDWSSFQSLDPCFASMLDLLFKFGKDELEKLEEYFNPRIISEAIAEFAKDLTLESSKFASPFWVRAAGDRKYRFNAAVNERNRKIKMKEPLSKAEAELNPAGFKDLPFMTKPDDITVIATLIVRKDIHEPSDAAEALEKEIAATKKAEFALLSRLNFMEQRNQLEFKQDIWHIANFS